MSARRARAKRRWVTVRAIAMPALRVVALVAFAPHLPCFVRGGFDELCCARLDGVRRLINALLQVVELDSRSSGEITVAPGHRITQLCPGLAEIVTQCRAGLGRQQQRESSSDERSGDDSDGKPC